MSRPSVNDFSRLPTESREIMERLYLIDRRCQLRYLERMARVDSGVVRTRTNYEFKLLKNCRGLIAAIVRHRPTKAKWEVSSKESSSKKANHTSTLSKAENLSRRTPTSIASQARAFVRETLIIYLSIERVSSALVMRPSRIKLETRFCVIQQIIHMHIYICTHTHIHVHISLFEIMKEGSPVNILYIFPPYVKMKDRDGCSISASDSCLTCDATIPRNWGTRI